MLSQSKRVVVVASKAELTNPHYSRRLWLAARNMHISRRKWPDVIADAIYNFKGEIMIGNGMCWPLPYMEDVYGNDSRWFSYYLEAIDGEPRRTVRLIERLRLIDIYFRIKYPHIAQHFGR
ncbi:MAG: hypothetical protein ABTQ25_02115 [Nitrosomonas ureae]